MYLSCLTVLFLFLGSAAATGPQVTLDFGTFEGVTNTTRGVSVDTFFGLPFAAPPVGDLRLRHPASLGVNYGGAVQDASVHKSDCMQTPSLANAIPANYTADLTAIGEATAGWPGTANTAPTSEDCLYLNVVRPAGVNTTAKLPVLFWIYGGGGINGGISAYETAGADLVAASVAEGQPIIFVAANYRMSIWGLLPGKEVLDAGISNLALLDQRAAMLWVNKYILHFGGDPDQVTISGGSAGSICVAFQLLLFGGDTQGTFHRAILQSGSVVALAPTPPAYPQAMFDLFASSTGCGTAADKLACLRAADNDVLAASVGNTTFWYTIRDLVLYAPQVDGWSVPRPPQDMFSSGQFAQVPIIIGDVEDEGAGFEYFWLNVTDDAGFKSYVEAMASFTPETVEQIIQAYPQDPAQGSPFNTGDLYAVTPESKRINALFGDFLFQAPRRFLASIYASRSLPVWSYLYSHSKVPWVGASHGSDIASFFGLLPDEVAAQVQSSYIAFIVSGDPNAYPNAHGGGRDIGLPRWPGYAEGSGKNLMNFGVNGTNTTVVIQDTYRAKGMQIWSDAVGQFGY